MINKYFDDCTLDVIIKPDQVKEYLKHGLIGTYVLFIKREPMYVGKSDELLKRLLAHLNKHSANTIGIIDDVDEIGLKLTSTSGESGYHEMAFIRTLNPPLNKQRLTGDIYRMILRRNTTYCKEKRVDGKPCSGFAHTNGYCFRHGGNGVTRDMVAKEEFNKLESDTQIRFVI